MVTLVAIKLTHAVGVALGGCPLSEVDRRTLSSSTTEPEAAETAGAADFGDTFARGTAGRLYAGGLDTRPVALVTLPGAPEEIVSGISTDIGKAGGSVTATYAVQPAMVDPSEKSLVDTLGSQLMTQLGSDAADADASTYPRIGQLLGTAIASTEATGSPVVDGTTAIRQSLAGAELVSGPEDEVRRAPLVLVVLGDDVDDDVLAGLLAGLAARSVGVVTVGDTAAADGDLAGLRTSPVAAEIATVDGAERDLGRVTSVLALIRSLKTTGGSFGASGADGAVPLG